MNQKDAFQDFLERHGTHTLIKTAKALKLQGTEGGGADFNLPALTEQTGLLSHVLSLRRLSLLGFKLWSFECADGQIPAGEVEAECTHGKQTKLTV